MFLLELEHFNVMYLLNLNILEILSFSELLPQSIQIF